MPRNRNRREQVARPSFLIIFIGLVGLAAMMAGLPRFIQPMAYAATAFTVNSTGDGADSNTADNLCDDGAGNCTLRAAIQQANATAGADAITFQLGSGPQTIRPTQPLPALTEPVVIDGATQPGYAGAPIIELDGSASSGNGLVLTGGDSTVRALVINRFSGTGIFIGGAKGGNRVEGCYIGTDLTGTLDRGNGQEGISLSNSNNVIGGTTPAARNVISGNGARGIEFDRVCCTGDESPIANNVIQGNYVGLNAAGDAAISNSGGGLYLGLINTGVPVSNTLVGGTAPGAGNVISGNSGNGIEFGIRRVEGNYTVQGNFVGTDATGSFAIPNGHGVVVGGSNNLIGGTTPAARNVISGNSGHGVLIVGSTSSTLRGNIIGANAALTAPIPNLLSGVVIGGSVGSCVVGGTGAGEANVIAFNRGNGLDLLRTGIDHRVRGNSIFSNGGDLPPGESSSGLGIDLGPAGVTPNDAGDADDGANRLQNFPVLTSVTPGASSFNVKGTLNSRASTTYDLDFHASGACDPSGFGEGARRVGSAQVTTDSGGNVAFDLTFDVALAASQVLTATATDPAGNTSEFSQCAPAGATAVGSVNFESTRVSVDESGGAATFVLTRTGGSAGTITVNYSVRNQTARVGSDFAATSGTLTFADGETSKSFTVPVLDDELDETTSETAVVSLSTTGDLDALGPRSMATLAITDNDPALTLSIGDVSAAEGNFGTETAFEFPVTLSAASGIDGVTLTYETESGTATGDGNDFVSASSRLTIPAGRRSGKITIFVYGDGNIESAETFFVNITSATSGVTIADGRGQGTILNDDVAMTFNVNSAGDGADSDLADGVCKTAANDCTLRAAIEQANPISGTDTINFSITGTINLTGALPNVTDNLTINGPGSSLLTVRRHTGGDYRIFNIINEVTIRDLKLNVSISGLTVANGRTADGDKDEFNGDAASGGALANGGTLTLNDVIFTGNSTGAGGASFGDGGDGGAIFTFGALTMTNVTLTGNSTGPGGAGATGGSGGDGGAIFNMGTLTMTGCVVRGNSTGGGGASTGFFNSGGPGGAGGGISGSFKPVMTMTDCVVSENTTGAGGDGNGSNGRGGPGGPGGGIYHDSGTLTLTRVSVGNNATGAGGKAPLGIPGPGGRAGGIFFGDAFSGPGDHSSGMLTDSTVSGNAGHADGGILIGGEFRMTNTTVSGNRLSGSGGSAVNSASGLATTLTNCTITANEGTGFAVSSGSAVVGNTIIAGNGGGTGPDTSGPFNSRGHNLVGNVGGSTGFTASGDRVGTSAAPLNPRLGPLADNGGPTLTHAPLAGSPALDAGGDRLAVDKNNNPLATDQRGAGFARFADAADADTTQTVDIGAFETNPSVEDIGDKATGQDVPLSFTFNVGDAAHGIASIVASSSDTTLLPNDPSNVSVTGTGSTRTLQLTPASNQLGTSTITVTVNGTNGRSMTDAFVLTVIHVNRAPTLNALGGLTINEDAGSQTVNLSGISAGPGETQNLTVTATSSNTTLLPNPTVTYTSPSSAGSVSFAPAADRSGTAAVTVTVTDDGGTAGGGVNTFSRTFNVTVNAVNDAPVANGGTLTFDEDVSTFASFAGSDTEGDSLTFAIVTEPSHGTLSGTGNGRTYTPAANYSGTDSFTYKAIDAHGAESAPATISLTINAVNDAPVNTVPGAQATIQHTPVVFAAANSNALSVADIDAGTDAIRVTLTATNGTVTLGSNAGLTFVTGDGADDASVSFTGAITAITAALDGLSFKPAQGFSGAATLQVVTDDQGRDGSGGTLSDTDSVTINVAAGGTLQFSAPALEVNENGSSVTVTVTRTGGSAGAASINYAANDGTANGGAACGAGVDYVNASGTLSWADGETTSKTFTLSVCDDASVEGDETVGLSLTGVTGSATAGATTSATLTVRDVEPSGGLFGFGQSSYDVAEGGTLVVTVRRAGSTSAAASVDYATDDGSTPSVTVPCSSTTGLALDRCDFTNALGTLTFAAGETEKRFNLLVGDDSYVEGAEALSLRLSNPTGGAALGAVASATVTVADDSPESSGNVIDDAAKFVTQHYRDFLNRDPDPGGLAFWVNGIESCGPDTQCRTLKRIDTSAAFFLSIEFQETGFLVHRMYKAAFGEATGSAVINKVPTQIPVPVVRLDEFLPDTQRIGRGVIVGTPDWPLRLEANKVSFAREFVERARFAAAFPSTMTPEQFVDRLDTNAGGVLSVDERARLIAELNGNNTPAGRASVLRKVAEDAGLAALETNKAFVLMQYFGYLRRNPDDLPDTNHGGYNFWLGKLDQFGGDFRQAQMVFAFIDSIEYRQRFAP